MGFISNAQWAIPTLDFKMYILFIGITYAGNHGMEINNADGTTFTQTMSGDYQNKLMTMLNTLNREVTNISLVEK